MSPTSEREGVGGWRDIETAPKTGAAIMVWSNYYLPGQPVIVRWDDDRFARKPVPRWVTRDIIYGRKAFVDQPPTHWMPLPDAPTLGDDGKVRVS